MFRVRTRSAFFSKVAQTIIFQTEESEPMIGMICIYLSCGKDAHGQYACYCHAVLARPNEAGVFLYKPSEDDLKKFCQNAETFRKCPRHEAFLDTFKTEYKKE